MRDLERIHDFCRLHRELILASDVCGCFYCLSKFPPSEITEWIPDRSQDGQFLKDVTAMCPRCGIDAVLPDNIPGVELTESLLIAMEKRWFDLLPTQRPRLPE